MKSRTKRKTPRVGDLVVVVFMDHAEDMGAIEFRLAGWVRKIDRASIEVVSWDYPDGRVFADNDPNCKWFSIVRKAIKYIKVIESEP